MTTALSRHSEIIVDPGSQPTVAVATMFIGKQMFGISVLEIRDIFRSRHIFDIPLAPKEVAGSINLRGRIVTVVDLRECLGLPAIPARGDGSRLCVTLEHLGELYGLLVDRVGDVIQLPGTLCEPVPATVRRQWRDLCQGVYRLDDGLLLHLDTTALLSFQSARDEAIKYDA